MFMIRSEHRELVVVMVVVVKLINVDLTRQGRSHQSW